MHDAELIAACKSKVIYDADGNHYAGDESYVTCFQESGGVAPSFSLHLERYLIYTNDDFVATISPGKTLRVPTGLSFKIPRGLLMYIQRRQRQHGLVLGDCYTGNVHDLHVAIKNTTNDRIRIEPGTTLCDFVFMAPTDMPVYLADFPQ